MRRFKTQSQILDLLEAQTRKAVRALEDERAEAFVNIWHRARLDVAAAVMREYHQDFPRGTWDIAQANQRGTLRRMRVAAAERLGQFKNEAGNHMRESLRALYREEVARGLWMLDQLTPPKVTATRPLRSREADGPQDYAAGWEDVLGAWINAYEDSLASGLRLEALHEGSLQDAADEVDAARIGNSPPANKLSALFTNQAILATQEARDDLAAANKGTDAALAPDVVAEEIWQTMEDVAVCPICEPYDGQPYDEVDDEIPAHFKCRCFTRLVPAAWAEMLRSGDEDDRAAALLMDDAGLVPDAMAVRGPRGELVAHFTIPFEKWVQGRGADIYGLNLSGATR